MQITSPFTSMLSCCLVPTFLCVCSFYCSFLLQENLKSLRSQPIFSYYANYITFYLNAVLLPRTYLFMCVFILLLFFIAGRCEFSRQYGFTFGNYTASDHIDFYVVGNLADSIDSFHKNIINYIIACIFTNWNS